MTWTERERFDSKWIPEPNTGCWLWLGAPSAKGYGRYYVPGSAVTLAHRHAWTFYCGPIPTGMVVDHICRVRSCVNPDHLRLVTLAENTLTNSVGVTAANKAKTHCKWGHPFTAENTYMARHSDGGLKRGCKACLVAGERHSHPAQQQVSIGGSDAP